MPPRVKSWLIGKYSDAGRDWGQEEKGTTEDEMAGWHHGLNGGESEWYPGDGDGQGGLVCCDSWGHRESNTTERLNWTELMHGTPLQSSCLENPVDGGAGGLQSMGLQGVGHDWAASLHFACLCICRCMWVWNNDKLKRLRLDGKGINYLPLNYLLSPWAFCR